MGMGKKIVVNRRKLINLGFIALSLTLLIVTLFLNSKGHKVLSFWLVVGLLGLLVIGKVMSVVYQNYEDNDYNLTKKRAKYLTLKEKEVETGSLSICQKMFVKRYVSLRKWHIKENIESIAAFLAHHISGPQDIYAGIYDDFDDYRTLVADTNDKVFAFATDFNEFLPMLYNELISVKNQMMNNPNINEIILKVSGLNVSDDKNINDIKIDANEIIALYNTNYDFNYVLVLNSVNNVNYAIYHLYNLLDDHQKEIINNLPDFNMISHIVNKSEKANITDNKPKVN